MPPIISLDREGVNYAKSFQVADAAESDWVLLPAGDGRKTVSVLPVAGTATLKFTTSGRAAVLADTANEQVQDAAIVADTSVVFDGPVTAIRVAASGGAVDVEVLA